MLCVLQRGHSGDGCDLASTLCKYYLRKGDLFVLSWARVQRVRQGSISSELQLLMPLVARCLETIDVCIWCMFFIYICCSDCPGVCCEAAVVEDSGFLALYIIGL